MKKFIHPFLMLILVSTLGGFNHMSAQTEYIKMLSDTFDIQVRDVISNSNGGYTVAGDYASDANGKQVFVAELESDGDLVWMKEYGGSQEDIGYSIVEQGCNYYVLGSTKSFGSGDKDFYLLKIDASGGLIWSRTYGGDEEDKPSKLLLDNNDNLVMVGSTRSFSVSSTSKSAIYAIKVYPNGSINWTKVIAGDDDEDHANSGLIDHNDNIYLTGRCKSFGEGMEDIFLTKINSSGTHKWTKTYGLISGESGHDLIEKKDSSGLFITGIIKLNSDNPSLWDPFILDVDLNGDNEEFIRLKATSQNDIGPAISYSADQNNILISGITESFGSGGEDFYLTELPEDLTTINWSYAYGDSDNQRAFELVANSDGITVVGTNDGYQSHSTLDLMFLRTDDNGVSCLLDMASPTIDTVELVKSSQTVSDAIGGVVDTATTSVYTMTPDEGDLCNYYSFMDVHTGISEKSEKTVNIFPNPSRGLISIESNEKIDNLEIYDSAGALVYKSQKPRKLNSIDLSDQTNGVYLVKLNIDGHVITKKVILE